MHFHIKLYITFKATVLLFFSFLFYEKGNSQIIDSTHLNCKPIHIDSTAETDLIDIYNLALGKYYNDHNVHHKHKTGRTHFSFIPVFGYSLQTGFAFDVAANAAFYTSNREDANLSSITANIALTQYKQLILPVQTNLWSKNNEYNFVGDWRYLIYPQATYGLGIITSFNQPDTVSFYYIRFYEVGYKKILKDFYLGLGYNLDYHWNIIEFNNQLDQFGVSKLNNQISSGVSFNVLFDDRRNSINPQKGNYFNCVLRQNLTAIGSGSNWQSLMVDVRKYIPLTSNHNQIIALWSYNYFTLNGDPPYFDKPSTGSDMYSNSGRGYIPGRYRGNDLMYVESEYRFTLSKNKFFGGVIFANAQTVTELNTNKFSSVAPGVGAGLRIKINKHSNTNIAIDYGWGVNGTNSQGVFVNLGEVF